MNKVTNGTLAPKQKSCDIKYRGPMKLEVLKRCEANALLGRLN